MSNNTIRYSEKWIGIQGEGRYVGAPSIFLRLFGCNFRCPKFNGGEVIDGQNAEVIQVIKDLDKYQSNQELPLVHTGCDSYMSVYPEFKKFAHTVDIETLSHELNRLVNYSWNDVHLVITGGEPLLPGYQAKLINLLDMDNMNCKFITFETNGSQALTSDMANFLSYLQDWEEIDITFSVSPKLSSSGESWEKAICPSVIAGYNIVAFTYLKFVVADEADVIEVVKAVEQYREYGFGGPVYLMPAGGTVETYNANKLKVADLAMLYGFRYSPRLHVDLFGNKWST